MLRDTDDTEAAIQAARNALNDAERDLGADHPTVGLLLSDLGSLYLAIHNYDAARRFLIRAYKLFTAQGRQPAPGMAPLVTNLGSVLLAQGEPGLALTMYRHAASMYRDLGLPEQANTLQEAIAGLTPAARRHDAMQALIREGRYAEALEPARQHARWRHRQLPPGHYYHAVIPRELAQLHRDAGRLDEALSLFEQARDLAAKIFDEDDPQLWAFKGDLGTLHHRLGHLAEAERLLTRTLEVDEAAYPPDDPQLAADLNNLANVYISQNRFIEARPLLERALAIEEAAAGDPYQLAISLDNLAHLYSNMGEYALAEPMHQRSLALFEGSVGPAHPDTAICLKNMAETAMKHSRFNVARQNLERVQTIYRELYGENSHQSAAISLDLGVLNRREFKLDSAWQRIEKARAVLQASYGTNDLRVADATARLAEVAQSQGRYNVAGKLLRSALKIKGQRLGTYHPDTVARAVALARLYYVKADYGAAEGIYRPAIETYEKNPMEQGPALASALNDYGNLLMDTGRLDEALDAQRRALEIRRASFEPGSHQVIQSTNNLAEVYRLRGDYAAARPRLETALEGFEQLYGPDHPEVARVQNNLGLVEHALGDPAGAARRFARALEIEQATLGPQHPLLVRTLINLAVAHWAGGDHEQALDLLSRARELRRRHAARALSSGSERHRLSQARDILNETDILVSFHLHAMPQDTRARDLAFSAVLQTKGQVLDAMVDTNAALRERLPAAARKTLDDLSRVRSELATAFSVGTRAHSPPGEELEELLGREERLQRSLSEYGAAYGAQSKMPSLEQVAAQIPPEGILVEITRYRALDPHRPDHARTPGTAHYAAYLLHPDGRRDWVQLGEAAVIDNLAEAFRTALSAPDKKYRQVARRLDKRIMRPIRDRMGGAKVILLSPDSSLTLIPFAALLHEDGRYLLQHHMLTYLDAGRDLMRVSLPQNAGGPSVAVGNPNYGVGPRQAGRPYWKMLPNTLEEVEAVAAALGGQTLQLTWNQATSEALRHLHGPRVLHVATHGYLDTTDAGSETPAINPLLRSGLALAGANAAEKGADGLLTALEICGMDLHDTRLVTLSACESGLGDIQRSEGVHGLRRALTIAGSRSQIISLWRISSKATVELMRGLYTRLAAGDCSASALLDTQRDMLEHPKYNHPYYWAAFIHTGAWGPLSNEASDPPPPL